MPDQTPANLALAIAAPGLVRMLHFVCSVGLWLPTPAAGGAYAVKYHFNHLVNYLMRLLSSVTSMSTFVGKFAKAMSTKKPFIGKEMLLALLHLPGIAVIQGYVLHSRRFPKSSKKRINLHEGNLVEFLAECVSKPEGHEFGISFHMPRPASSKKRLFNVSSSSFLCIFLVISFLAVTFLVVSLRDVDFCNG